MKVKELQARLDALTDAQKQWDVEIGYEGISREILTVDLYPDEQQVVIANWNT